MTAMVLDELSLMMGVGLLGITHVFATLALKDEGSVKSCCAVCACAGSYSLFL